MCTEISCVYIYILKYSSSRSRRQASELIPERTRWWDDEKWKQKKAQHKLNTMSNCRNVYSSERDICDRGYAQNCLNLWARVKVCLCTIWLCVCVLAKYLISKYFVCVCEIAKSLSHVSYNAQRAHWARFVRCLFANGYDYRNWIKLVSFSLQTTHIHLSLSTIIRAHTLQKFYHWDILIA